VKKFGQENSIYDLKRGSHTLGTFSPFVFTNKLLVFRFLCWGQATMDQYFGSGIFCRLVVGTDKICKTR
jgi:hypothetical protein